MPKIAVYTLGCRANQYDTESLYESFRQNGFERAGEYEPAEVHLVNTCTVTNSGDRKSRQLIRKLVRQRGTGKVVVTGCAAQQDPNGILDLGVDLVVDNANKNDLFHLFSKSSEKKMVHSTLKRNKELVQQPISKFEEKTRAHLKIQDGCDQFCTYCIIPFVRGRSRSLAPQKVLQQLKDLVAFGYREIVLTGIHTGHYHFGEKTFVQLLGEILDHPGDFRVRLSSIEPREIHPAILDLFEKFPNKFCRHLHIAIQSASTPILASMRRGYDSSYLESLFDSLYSIDKLFGIGVDVITGFPGESESHFIKTINFLKQYSLSYGHIFPFSPKKGTPASKLDQQIPEKIKKDRSRILRKAMQEIQCRFLEQSVGSIQRVLFENNETGFTDNYTRVRSPGGKQGVFSTVQLGPIISQLPGEKFPAMEGRPYAEIL